MINYRILQNEGIVIIEPAGPISRTDLQLLTRDVDNYIGPKGKIRGFIIHARSFPRWRDLGAFLRDMQFVLAHQRRIRRVASVTDSGPLMLLHGMARHVLSPEIRHFPYGSLEAALQWLRALP